MTKNSLPETSISATADSQSLGDDELLPGISRLCDGACVWFLTNVECTREQYFEYSKPRDLFLAWGYDLNAGKFGLFAFGIDFARGMVQARVEPLPWKEPLQTALSFRRPSHGANGGSGRFEVSVKKFALPEDVLARALVQAPQRSRAETRANAGAETWVHWQPTSMVTEEDVEAAVPKLQSPFSRGDLVKAVGDPKAPITKVLKRLVKAGRLKPSGNGKGKKYDLVHRDIERKDWVG